MVLVNDLEVETTHPYWYGCFTLILLEFTGMGLILVTAQALQQTVLIMLDLLMVEIQAPLVFLIQMILSRQFIYSQCTDLVKLQSFCHCQSLTNLHGLKAVSHWSTCDLEEPPSDESDSVEMVEEAGLYANTEESDSDTEDNEEWETANDLEEAESEEETVDIELDENAEGKLDDICNDDNNEMGLEVDLGYAAL
ncbi:hypothetical protein EDD18DRAFT_1110108 [Armillaria luteobubalina]|uniref:Uncharacterized protein n=1 Tax=Armillaria luteobubalina TaxID=153913 RepID=A0AA39UIW2_9AGAR|nr:hypothetical protein EDD18DRAFT_1110108 [Armillaria luteobubalina]